MPEPQQQIVVYARIGSVCTERRVCSTMEEAYEALEMAAKDANELAEMFNSTEMVPA